MINQILWLAYQLLILPFTLIKYLTLSKSNRQNGTEESYSSFNHLALNVKRPQTEWFNMGDWTDIQDDLPMACRQLCERLYSEADIRAGAKILDVGHGCGDSLLLLMQRYRPSVLHGVTSMPSHAKRAKERVENLKTSSTGKFSEKLEVKVFCNDAVAHVENLQQKQSSEEGGGGEYDFIFALDCAYHFQTRQKFIKSCYKILKPGGTLALVDLIATHPYPNNSSSASNSTRFHPSPSIPSPSSSTPSLFDQIKHSFVLRMAKVPSINMISANTYLDHLDQAGYEDVSIQDISHAMFPNFAKFLQNLGKSDESSWRGGSFLQLMGLRSFGSIVQGWSEGGDRGMVRSVIVIAKKP